METTIKTSFNFAKEIQCNFITKNNPEHSYPGGLPEFITPYLQELQENTLIPDYTTLISITTIDNPDQEPLYESEHIIILDSDSTIGCQE